MLTFPLTCAVLALSVVSGGEASAPGSATRLNEAAFDRLEDGMMSKPAFVRFDGLDCDTCATIDKDWDTLIEAFPEATFAVVDCAQHPALCKVAGDKTLAGRPLFGCWSPDGPPVMYGGVLHTDALIAWVDDTLQASVLDVDGRQANRNFDRIHRAKVWTIPDAITPELEEEDEDAYEEDEDEEEKVKVVVEDNVKYMAMVNELLHDPALNIRSVVEVGSGDWTVTQLDLSGLDSYHGYDLSATAVSRAEQLRDAKHGSEAVIKVRFTVSSFDQRFESADLIIVKDVLQHLPLKDVQNITDQLPSFRFALFTNDVAFDVPNDDIDFLTKNSMHPGGFRSLDVTKAPYHISCARTHLLHRKAKSIILGARKKTCFVDVGASSLAKAKMEL
jgi:hypothetical protein